MSKLTGPIQSIVIFNQSLLGLGSCAAAVLFPNVVHCGHWSPRTGTGPTPDGLSRRAVAEAVAQTRFFICSHAVGNSEDDYIPTRCLLIILNHARK